MSETTQFAHLFQLLGAVFAALLGLAFGSFLNVVLARMPEGESVAAPGSHCRTCDHTLAWWENLPVLSWLLLRGRCRQCGLWIGLRYPLIELAIAFLWTAIWLKFSNPIFAVNQSVQPHPVAFSWTLLIAWGIFAWLLVALAALDAQFFWLPDRLTLPAIGIGLLFALISAWQFTISPRHPALGSIPWIDLWTRCLEAIVCGGLILLIRLAYWLVRRKEGMGLGDAKLMAMLGAWLGLAGGMESFVLAILGAFATAIVWLIFSLARGRVKEWAQMPLPFGTFLCLAALSEIFYPAWLSVWWINKVMP